MNKIVNIFPSLSMYLFKAKINMFYTNFALICYET